ncbi:thioesterase II family protein [Glycomyces xiaoerkulensis]|uniref:thioesterase II family protein n=1 Tax=Glycomyces xiaoerkulensis TaxID=2038139 RepID=UPI0018E4691A|nr:alpha/beta fold hydrolase [Glycomyces xiaoerkulensis]
MSASDLLWNLRPSETGRQIVMFPFLGGFGASFNHLVKRLSGDWDVWTVNPPGHGPSTRPPLRRLGPLVDCYLEGLRDVLKPGAVFFGHSMGGVVAYHVLLAMGARPDFESRRPPDLVLSASNAPRHLPVVGYATLPEPDLLGRLSAFGAISEEMVSDRSLVDLFLPAFRADYHVLEEARRLPPTRLDVRTRLILGGRDPHTADGAPEAWQDYIGPPIRTHVLEREEHMFVLSAIEPVDRIINDLNEVPA